MKKTKITVYDYGGTKSSARWHWDMDKIPITHKVSAWCVGGKYGVFAYFYLDGHFCEATGDDGSWIITWTCHPRWVPNIQEVIAAVTPSISIDYDK